MRYGYEVEDFSGNELKTFLGTIVAGEASKIYRFRSEKELQTKFKMDKKEKAKRIREYRAQVEMGGILFEGE